MRALLAVLVAGVLFGSCVVADHAPWRYNISLNDDPTERYYHVVSDMCHNDYHKGAFLFLLNNLDQGLLNNLPNGIKKDELFYAISQVFSQPTNPLHEFWLELTGISDAFREQCGVIIPPGELATLNLIYHVALKSIVDERNNNNGRDMFATEFDQALSVLFEQVGATFGGMACTSIVAADSTGHVIHGRNLDWSHAELYQPLSTELTYFYNGNIVAVTTSFFPELSPTTLITPRFAFSYNARVVEMGSPTCLLTDLQTTGGQHMTREPFPLVVRMLAFQQSPVPLTYEMVVGLLNVTYCSPAYIALSGPGPYQGALLTTHVDALPDIRPIGQPYSDDGDEREPWYVVVANEDIEYRDAKGWLGRYNQTLEILKVSNQNELTTLENIDKDLLNVTGVRVEGGTCYMGAMDVNAFKYNFVVRSSTIFENNFYQAETIPERCESRHYDPYGNCEICLPWFTGENCQQCYDIHFDSAKNCSQCAPKFKGSDCRQCSNLLYDAAHDCETCVKDHYDPAAGCGACLPAFTGEGCMQCSNDHYDPEKGCAECLPGYSGDDCSKTDQTEKSVSGSSRLSLSPLMFVFLAASMAILSVLA